MLLDTSIANQSYVEDCEVCCNPIEINSQFLEGHLIKFEGNSLEQ